MRYTQIEFSPWTRWKDRGNIKNSKEPGVYALSKFGATPPFEVDLVDKRIIYFGETCNQNLLQRWRQFEDSAFHQKRGHSGGKTYRKSYPRDDGGDLYVSAMPVPVGKGNEDKVLAQSFIRFTERKLIFDYVMKWKEMPKCNTK